MVSDLIDELQKYREMYGDIPVVVVEYKGKDQDNMVPIYGLAPITALEDGTPEQLVICGEEVYDTLYETNQYFPPE